MPRVSDEDWPRIASVVTRVPHGVLATIGAADLPHGVLVNPFAWGAARMVVVFSRPLAAKVRHVRSRPSASVTLQEGTGYLTIAGAVRVEDDPAVLSELVGCFEAKYGRAPRTRTDRVALVLAPQVVLGALG